MKVNLEKAIVLYTTYNAIRQVTSGDVAAIAMQNMKIIDDEFMGVISAISSNRFSSLVNEIYLAQVKDINSVEEFEERLNTIKRQNKNLYDEYTDVRKKLTEINGTHYTIKLKRYRYEEMIALPRILRKVIEDNKLYKKMSYAESIGISILGKLYKWKYNFKDFVKSFNG